MNWLFGVILGILVFLFFIFLVVASNGSWMFYNKNNVLNSNLRTAASPEGPLLKENINNFKQAQVQAQANAQARANAQAQVQANAQAQVQANAQANAPLEQEQEKSFNQLYVDFGNHAMGYLSGEIDKKHLINSINSLSNVLCSKQKEDVALLYIKKMELLEKLINIFKKNNDIYYTSFEVNNIKKKIREYSDRLSKVMCNCLNVKFSEIRYFFTLSDSIVIKYAVEQDENEKNKVKSIFHDIVSKMILE
jgi:hypothetical protein